MPSDSKQSSVVFVFQGALADSNHFTIDVSDLLVGAMGQVQQSGSPLIKASNGVELRILVATKGNKPVWAVLDETFRASLGRSTSNVTSEADDVFVVHKLTITNPQLSSTEISVKRWNRRSGEHFSLSFWSPDRITDTSNLEKRLVKALQGAKSLP